MSDYNLVPGVDDGHNFPPEVRQALAAAHELANVFLSIANAPGFIAQNSTVVAAAAAAVAAATVNQGFISASDARIPTIYNSGNDLYAYVKVDATGKISFAVKQNGHFYAPHLDADTISINAFSTPQLSADQSTIGGVISSNDSVSTNYAQVVLDTANRIVSAVKKNGHVYIPFLDVDSIAVGAISLATATIAGKSSSDDGIHGLYSYAFTDAAGRISEHVLDGQGFVPQWVLDRWVSRFNGALLADAFDTNRLAMILYSKVPPAQILARQDASGNLVLVESRAEQFLTNGDSITQGVGDDANLGGWPGRLATLIGQPVQNIGLAARASTDLAMRQGGVVPLVTVTGNQIPASGSVAVTQLLPSTSWRYDSTGSFDFPGTLAGIPGNLSHAMPATAPDQGWTFVRSSAGSAVSISPHTPFIATSPANSYLDATYITAPGRNNQGLSNYLDAVRDAQAEIARLTPLKPRFLVLSILTSTTETSGSSSYSKITAANTAMAARFGDRYLDVRRYLIDNGLAYNNITPTTADLTSIAGDTYPPSLSADGLHPNQYGYNAMANCIRNALVAKGWA